MDIDNSDKRNLIGVIAILLAMLVIIGLTFVAVNKKVEKKESSPVIKKVEIDETEQNKINENELKKLTDGMLHVLYNYGHSDSSDLITYFKSLSNNQKLYVGGILDVLYSNSQVNFNSIQDKIINVFGNDLEVQASDYYVGENAVPLIVYNIDNNSFSYNLDIESPDYVADIGLYSIYNYKVEDIVVNDNEVTMKVLGLYRNESEEIAMLVNNKGLARYIGVDNRLADFSYSETEADYLNNLYNNDSSQFIEFEYVYSLSNDNYILKDFRIKE